MRATSTSPFWKRPKSSGPEITRAQLGQVGLGLDQLGCGGGTVGRCHAAAGLAELGLGRAQLGLGGATSAGVAPASSFS
jgi:hypothetical protein